MASIGKLFFFNVGLSGICVASAYAHTCIDEKGEVDRSEIATKKKSSDVVVTTRTRWQVSTS